MKCYLIFATFIFLLLSCGNKNATPSPVNRLYKIDNLVKTNDSLPVISSDNDTIPFWCDTIIQQYIRQTHNELIEGGRKDTSVKIGWMLDSRDSVYLVFHLGHDVAESDGSDPRFVTDGWLEIDSLTRKLYEYDIAGDSLIPVDYNRTYDPTQFQSGNYIIKASDVHKVYFHTTPEDATIRKAFFNSEQKVYVGNILNGYGFITFTSTQGKKSNGWIEMKDMIRCTD